MRVVSTKPTFSGAHLWSTVVLLLIGTGIMLAGFMTGSVPAIMIGAVGLLAGFLLRSQFLVRRLLGGWVEEPEAAAENACPMCHHNLQGVVAPFCPECGTVRPRVVAEDRVNLRK